MKKFFWIFAAAVFVFSLNALVFTQDATEGADKTAKNAERKEKKKSEFEELGELFKDDADYQKILGIEKKLEELKKTVDAVKDELTEAMKAFKEKIKDDPKYKEYVKQKKEEAERIHQERMKTDPEYKRNWEEEQAKRKEYSKERYELKKKIEESLKDTEEYKNYIELREKKNEANKAMRKALDDLADNILNMTVEQIEKEKVHIAELKAVAEKIERQYNEAADVFNNLVAEKMKEYKEKESSEEGVESPPAR